MFYLSRIRLTDVKCFPGEVAIDFPRPTRDGPNWTLILGDNGTGKTSILRSIAMCLCDETGASGLLSELSVEVIRHGCKEAKIEIDLVSAQRPRETHTIVTTFQQSESDAEYLRQKPRLPARARHQLFACGYGAALGTIGSEVVDRYRVVDAVYSLFNYDARLQNPENALYRITDQSEQRRQAILRQIDRVLTLDEGSTKLDHSGLRIRGPWGDYVPASGLGDGYAATLAKICDLLGYWSLASGGKMRDDVQGIVLIDEIEQHLHPSWQREIVRLLAQEFPRVQFIVTTHAPLTVIGSSSLSDDASQLIVLEHDDDRQGVSVRPAIHPAPQMRADQVLTSFLFGLASTSAHDLVNKIERYAELQRQDSPDADELQNLRDYLTHSLGTLETDLQRKVEEAIHRTLATMTQDYDIDSLTFEVRRQLNNLWGRFGDAQ